MASIDSLNSLLEEELKDLFDAEKQLTRALPKMVKKASSPDLKEALQEHLRQTEGQIDRLEQVFEALELPARGKKCVGMQNLIKEGDEMIAEVEEGALRDAVIIASAQKVEHYEMAGYGTARTWAKLLGHTEAADLLEETLDEEKDADKKLTGIAESHVNMEAASGEEVEEEDAGSRMARGRKAGSRRASGTAARQMAADRAARGRSRSRR